MRRVNKKSRIKGLPPRILLQTRDAHSGSIPAKLRAASDNRTGNYGVFWDDINTVVFTSSLNYIHGAGITDNIAASNPYQELGQDMSASMTSETRTQVLPTDDSSPISFFVLNGSRVDTGSAVVTMISSGSEEYTLGVTGAVSGAFNAVGNEDFIITQGVESDVAITGTLSISCLYKGDTSVGTNVRYIITHADGDDTFMSYMMGVRFTGGNNTMWYQHDDDVSIQQKSVAIGTNGINRFADTWTHLTLIREEITPGTFTLKFFLDGIFQASSSATLLAGASDAAERLSIGRQQKWTLNHSDGHISHVKIHNTVLSDTQVQVEAEKALAGLPVQNTNTLEGNVIKGVSDTHMLFTPGQTIEPFTDSGNPAGDGKSLGNPFYFSGSKISDVGEGFDQPLWSKTKLEIDITPIMAHSVSIEGNNQLSNRNHPMMYWNDIAKRWQGIGPGTNFIQYSGSSLNTLTKFLDEATIGVGATLAVGLSTINGFENAGALIGQPISNFGFPAHAKFHATSSNTIKMTDYINEPFLIEKVICCISMSYQNNQYFASSPGGQVQHTFLLLNQKKNQKTDFRQNSTYWTGSNDPQILATSASIPTTFNGSYIDTTRDVITWLQIGVSSSFDLPIKHPSRIGIPREYVIRDLAGSREWSKQLFVSGNAKNPIEYEGYINGISSSEAPSGDGEFHSPEYRERWNFSSHSSVEKASGRSLLNTIQNPEITGQGGQENFWTFNFDLNVGTSSYDIPQNVQKTNPYLIHPEDELVLCWHLPYSMQGQAARFNSSTSAGAHGPNYDGQGPTYYFGIEGVNKIIIYGSYIREGKEHHDTLNQLLTSTVVHEEIGND